MKKFSIIILIFTVLYSCKEEEKVNISITTEDYHAAVDKVTQVMVHDIFSPPVASRVFAYPNIAAYEIMTLKHQDYNSLGGQIAEFTKIPKPKDTTNLNYELAALVAHMELSKQLIFSEQKIEVFRDSLYTKWKSTNPKQFETSKTYGLKVVEFMGKWINTDNYKETRTMPKFSVFSDDPSRWQPTPPAYMDGIEPHWSKIRTLVLDSAAQFKPIPPPSFSMEKSSVFYKELEEVYTISNDITKKGDTSEEMKIAQFWDCNPEAFISCWDEKYRSNLIRPETLINQHIDDSWEPILQTPPFPEYTSGHSVVSGSASAVLTSIFGDNFQFDDDTEVPYGLPVRSFQSFNKAAEEAAVSRLYGGIHYKAAVEVGLKQGQELGKHVVAKFETNK